MINIFTSVLKMSVSASILVLAVIVARTVMRKSPKWIMLLLWCFVALRLVIPFTIENPYSVQPKSEEAVYNVVKYDGSTQEITLPYQLPAPIINNDIGNSYEATRFETPSLYTVLSMVWVIGISVMVVYAIVSYIKLYVLTRGANKTDKGFYSLDKITAPFVFGMIRPRIFIPQGYKAENLPYIIAHEKVHISRLDHIWKPLGFLILSVHWFNPLVWLAYWLFCKDLESACDERAIKEMNVSERADYAQALLDCSARKSFISVCPVAFGENNVKDRIKSVLSYKKPAVWIIAISVILCVAVAFFFMTDKKGEEKPDDVTVEVNKGDITVEIDKNDITVVSPKVISPDYLEEDIKDRFPDIHQTAIEYACDIGFENASKRYHLGASVGHVAVIDLATTENVSKTEVVELYYTEYHHYENTIDPSVDDPKIVYPSFFALHHDLKTDKWTRLGSITDYHMKQIYKAPEMIEKYGNELTATAIELYREYFHLDMSQKEQMILWAYDSATEAAGWFRWASILESRDEYPKADDRYVSIDGRRYFKVKRFSTYDEFMEHLEMLFSKELIAEFLKDESIKYIDINGELYATTGIRGTNIHMGDEHYTIEDAGDSKYIVKVTVDVLGEDAVTVVGSEVFEFPYEFIGDRWVFTEFPEIR